MKLTIEGRELELSANGRFIQKYCKVFDESITPTLYNAFEKNDLYSVAKLMYCAIDEEMSFDEWLDSFNSPLFLLKDMHKVINFLVSETQPTVEAKGDKNSSKKKKKN